MTFRAAALRYELTAPSNFGEYAAKVGGLVEEAARGGAKLLLFPEYGSLDLVPATGGAGQDLRTQLKLLSPLESEFKALFASLAARHGVYLAAPTFPVSAGEVYFNRCHFFGPEGGVGEQDKLVLTPYEFDTALLVPGVRQNLFETELGKIGILVCYDAEFPLLARNLALSGAQILLVPSCTDAPAGAARIRVAAAARALEGRALVLTSTTAGEAPWCSLVDENTGDPAALAPPDRPFPDSGVLALLAPGQGSGWLFADFDPALLEEKGDVDVHGGIWEHQVNRVGRVPLT